ncbi:TPA: VOC family protein [Thermoplasmata archaeon]|nr:VOC family protein [Thermoplasmata archaeon]
MPGMIFLGTARLEETVEFYKSRMGMEVWLEQEDCTILRFQNLYLGFCRRKDVDTRGIITFWYDTREEVDRRYEELADLAEGAPVENPKYKIYHFFLKDPEGRTLEVQKFLDL